MINFFRRIRRNLADNNQFLKYSRYAIGEIVLVVIGILIALQINEWNGERKQNIRKLEIVESLTTELNEVKDYTLKQSNSLNDRIELFTEILNEWETFDPTVMSDDALDRYYWFIHTMTLLKYNPRTGYYNSLISSGEIDLLPDSTVVKLNYVYDSHRKDVVTYVNQEVDLHIVIAEVVAKNHSQSFLSGKVPDEAKKMRFVDTPTIIRFFNSIKSDGELKSLILRNLYILEMKNYLITTRILPDLNDLIENLEEK